MARMKLLAAPLAAFLLAAALGWWLLAAGEEVTQASPTLTVGVDANPSGNTATSLGVINDCREVSAGQTFDVDIYITDVTDLLAWEMIFNYDGPVVSVESVDVKMFQAANPDSNILDLSYSLDIGHFVSAADIGTDAEDSGSGVLARLTLGAAGTGVTPITLGAVVLKDKENAAIGDTNGDVYYDGFNYSAWVAVDQACPDEPPPTATPPVTPTPEPSPTASPTATPPATPSATPTPPAPAVAWMYSCYLGSAQPPEVALAGVTGDVLAAYRLRPDQSYDRWLPARPDVSNMTTVNPYDALFVLMASDATWAQEPSGEPSSDANLVFGWNSVCYTGQTKDATAATQGIASQLALIYTLAANQSWQRFVPGRPEVSNLTQLESYMAGLILISADSGALWVFDP